jgi:hypothetical protein
MSSSVLLTVDAAINLALGAVLILFPAPVVAALGIPASESAFYPSILGGVLLGIGIALLLQRRSGNGGLGLLGAVAINLIAGSVLAGWLLWGSLALPLRGRVLLWGLVVVLLGVSLAEVTSHVAGRPARRA